MSTDTERRDDTESAAALITAPKASVWQGFLGAAWVLSSSLLLEVVAKLLEGSVGQSHVLNSLAGVLRWVAVAVVLAAALYVLWRKSMDMREGARIRRELDLTSDLVEPPAAVARTVTIAPALPPEPAPRLDAQDEPVVAVLRALPFADYESAALYDMVSAMLDCVSILPGDQAVARRHASDVLIRLAAGGIVAHDGHDRFRVDRGDRPPAGPGRDVCRTPQWRAALPALVRHYADLAHRWAVALDSDRLGAGAHRWFLGSADRLAALLCACAEAEHGIELDITALARIADALDLWYARIGVPPGSAAAVAMRTLASRSHPEIRELASIRCGDLSEPESGSRRRPWARVRRRRGTTGLRARRAHETALRGLQRYRRWDGAPGPAAAGSLSEVVDGFERAWWLFPRRDTAGEVCALIDLAIAQLHQGRLDAARDRLELAEALTRGGRNPSGRAHTFEILGVLWWMRGEPRRALRWWLLALTRYRDLGHELGICRCLQHLGSAVVVVPEYGGLVLAGPVDTGEVLSEASGWLAYAEQHRPDRPAPDSLLARRYRRQVTRVLRAARVQVRDTVGRWPIEVSER
ncbi:hypothetical protein [Nocardia spumae]|uniref:hypothetical protein n=1 Tax=Nocardia spumae TaxID=2887190 RepID=UPI001D1398E8|nr:hypothetical protein [Nocardia spumae]